MKQTKQKKCNSKKRVKDLQPSFFFESFTKFTMKEVREFAKKSGAAVIKVPNGKGGYLTFCAVR